MKKFISAILCLCMLLCTFGAVTVFADDPWQGAGTEDNPWLISTADDLVTLSANAYNGYPYEGKYFKMTNDIDMSSVENFTPIGRGWSNDFRATFDGGNFRIKNLNIESGNGDGNGLFGYTTASTLKNIIIESGNIVATSGPVGAILGRANYSTNVINCKNYATVSGTWNVGGIVGDMWDSGVVIDGCFNYGTVSNTGTYTGGILGSTQQTKDNRTISNCVNNGTIISAGSEVGGIVGKAQGNWPVIENCVNNSDINVDNGSIGGIAGSMTTATIRGCVNNGNITGTKNNVAGIVGYNGGNIENCVNNGDINHSGRGGGITGDSPSGYTISLCVNNGDVTATGGDNGGISGHLNGGCLITDCYNTGAISGGTLGGITGSNENSKVINCYSIGTTSSNAAAVIGWQSKGAYANLYYDSSKCGGDSSSAGSVAMPAEAFASGEVAALLNANHAEYQMIEEVDTLVSVPASVWSNDEVQPIFADENNAPVYKYVIKGAKAEDIAVFPKVKAADSIKLIVASYTDLAMQDVESQSVETGDVEVTLSADFVKGDEVRVMIWDSYSTARPLTTIPVQ